MNPILRFFQSTSLLWIFLALAYMPLFGHLDSAPVRIWDEARNAANAYEMIEQGDPIVTYFQGQPDTWNTKPPLLIWTQTVMIQMMGYSELAIRLPSAIAGLLTALFLFFISRKLLGTNLIGFFASLALITCTGYVCFHGTRSGDYDAMLTLFTTASGLSLFAYTENHQSKYLYYASLALALAILTKGIAVLLFLPGWFLFLVIQKQILPLLKKRDFYLAALIPIFLAGGYYLLRESMSPGFLEQVQLNELGGRFLQETEHHAESFWFYFAEIIHRENSVWLLLVVFGLVTGIANASRPIRNLTIFSGIASFSFLLIISIAKTKLWWYTIPVYPLLNLLVGIAVYSIITSIHVQQENFKPFMSRLLPFAIVLVIFFNPYHHMLGLTNQDHETPDTEKYYELSYYLKKNPAHSAELSADAIVHQGYHAHLLFYVRNLNQQGNSIRLIEPTKVQPGTSIICNQQRVIDQLTQNFEMQLTAQQGDIRIYNVHARN